MGSFPKVAPPPPTTAPQTRYSRQRATSESGAFSFVHRASAPVGAWASEALD
jgi:hypothetical protein